jgi:excinuclease UvrABC nuclease subunit
VQRYLDSRAGTLVAELEAERDAASANLDFEQAAAVHARIEKVKSPWSGIAEIVGRIEKLRAVIIQRSALNDHVALFEFRNGLLYGPVQFDVHGIMLPNPNSGSSSLYAHPHIAVPVPVEGAGEKPAAKAKAPTLESRVVEALSQIEARRPERGEVADHLAIFKRWYYRSTRKGEVFVSHSDELPLRRIARGISRVFSGEKEKSPFQHGGKESTEERQ